MVLLVLLLALLALLPNRPITPVDIAKHITQQLRVQQFQQEQTYHDALPDWMRGLPDDRLASQVSIPGTHDSATFPCDYHRPCHIYQCQSLPFLQQLNNGVRFLDLRVNSQQPLSLGHMAIEYLPFAEATADIARFLRAHPSEFLILAFQRNQGT
jgi:hypothetical protein